jgi:hypothetical protein
MNTVDITYIHVNCLCIHKRKHDSQKSDLVIYVSVIHWYVVLFLDFIDIKIELLSHQIHSPLLS